MSTTTGIIQQSSNPAQWSPIDLGSGLLIWLDAAKTSSIKFSSGNKVDVWEDQSGNNRHVIQNTVDRQPTYPSTTLINSKPGVYFDYNNPTHQYLDTAANFPLSGNTPYTMIVVALNETTEHQYASIGFAVNNVETNQLNAVSGLRDYQVNFGYFKTFDLDSNNSTNTPILFHIDYDGITFPPIQSGAGNLGVGISVYINDVGKAWTQDPSFPVSITQNPFRVGNGAWAIRDSRAVIAEVVVLNRLLTTLEKNELYSYLDAKWNLL